MYEHMVSCPAKANSDVYSARPLGSVNIFEMSHIFAQGEYNSCLTQEKFFGQTCAGKKVIHRDIPSAV